VQVLEAAGVDVTFGLPGGAISPVFDALLDHPGIRLVTTKHEAGAIFAAVGYARATEKLGVVVVTSGPGILNTLTGLATAFADGVPVLVLAGEVARSSQGKGGLQEGSSYALNVVGSTRPVCKWAAEIPSASAAPHMIRRAIETATSGRQGPVLLTLPLDVSSQAVAVPEQFGATAAAPQVAPEAVARALEALLGSTRKVILAGSGVRFGAGPARLKALAERLGCPVITTPKAKGVFPEGHPLALGVFGIGGHPSTSAFLAEGVETVLAVGTSLGDLATNGWSPLLKPSRCLIQVDIDGAQLGRAYAPQLAVEAPAEVFFDALLARLPAGRARRAGAAAPFGVRRYQEPEVRSLGDEGRITTQRALWELQHILPEDTVFTVDSGEHNVFAIHYVTAERPDAFIVMTGVGAMGSSVPAAVGAQLGLPGRAVAVLCGDGGFAICAPEIATAAQHGLPLVVAVFNDQRLGMVEIGHRMVYGRSPDFGLDPVDVAGLGAALGADTLTVTQPGELLAAAPRLSARTRPLVIDIRIDRTESMPRNARTQKLAEDMGWPGAQPPGSKS
jgi:acetolactate synthase-1/2/3 large subunit